MHSVLKPLQQALVPLNARGQKWSWNVTLYEAYFSLENSYLVRYDEEGMCQESILLLDHEHYGGLLKDLYDTYGAFSVRTNAHSGYCWKTAKEVYVEKDPEVAFPPYRRDWHHLPLRRLANIAQHLTPWPFEMPHFRLKMPTTHHQRLHLQKLHPDLLVLMDACPQCHDALPWCFFRAQHGIFLMLSDGTSVSEPTDFYPFESEHASNAF